MNRGFPNSVAKVKIKLSYELRMMNYFEIVFFKNLVYFSIDKLRENFSEFKMAFAEVETTFLQSKKTGRWWMQLPEGNFIACSHQDYLTASQNEIPERWMRAVERS